MRRRQLFAFSILYLFGLFAMLLARAGHRPAGRLIAEAARRVADDERQEWERRRRMRSIAIALALAALVVVFYVATLVRLGGNVMNRPL